MSFIRLEKKIENLKTNNTCILLNRENIETSSGEENFSLGSKFLLLCIEHILKKEVQPQQKGLSTMRSSNKKININD